LPLALQEGARREAEDDESQTLPESAEGLGCA
jgi:hypothetical protein